MTLGLRDKALVRFDGKTWSAYVCLDGRYDAYVHSGATANDAVNNAQQAASLKRELGEANVLDIPTPAQFAEIAEA